ncbi:ThiF family adenylyltransferase [Trinickia mobilis]|uniref:ThiF family adenylyltransferase n=1 Tax=Trinickia mobilis TaxID=2816356 RepID=UPI001A90A4ED|nr:ThiF family adenylyltransferase [Trinickia mobilis]
MIRRPYKPSINKSHDLLESTVRGLDVGPFHFLTFDANPIETLRRIRSATVCLLGVGGVGSVVLQHLVALGVRNYILVDSDCVEASNLNRQFIFSLNDIKKSKVDVAATYIGSRIDGASVNPFTSRVDSLEALERIPIGQCDIIVNCLDTPRQTIDDIAYEYGSAHEVAVITAGVGVYYGHWGPLICSSGNNVTYGDWKRQHSKTSDASFTEFNVEPIPWSFGPTNTLKATKVEVVMAAQTDLSAELLASPLFTITPSCRSVGHGTHKCR